MTGPNPDAELDEALGVTHLPPATVTEEHVDQAYRALWPLTAYRHPREGEIDDDQRRQVERVAQAIADAEQRGAARVIATRRAAGTET